MKNRIITFIGFVLGVAGFLWMFKILFLEHIPREDEVPPGAVVFAALMNGVLFGFLLNRIQQLRRKKRKAE